MPCEWLPSVSFWAKKILAKPTLLFTMPCEWLPSDYLEKAVLRKNTAFFKIKNPGKTYSPLHNALRMATFGFFLGKKKSWQNLLSHTIAHAVPSVT
jgi:hypothetical protein